jgi:hypothetical protein
MKSYGSAAAIYREIEASQGLFKYNNARLTLRDPKSKPFKGMSACEIDHFLSSMIERVGLKIEQIVRPGQPGARSSKFPTFVVGDLQLPIVFGFAHSAAEEIQISELTRALQKIIDRDGAARVWNGERFVQVNGIIRRGGSREKVDAIMHLDGDPMISISLKNLKSGKASEMQGWSGVRGWRGKRSIVDFADAAATCESNRSWRRIQDSDLKREACWGSETDNVDVIVAGSDLDLVEDHDGYRVTARTLGGIWYLAEGEIPDGEFEPVLFCRPSSEHSIVTSGGVVKGLRMMVAPLAAARLGRQSIEI